MFFGKRLKECRLEYAFEGLRAFALKMEMDASDYIAIEKGYTPPPEGMEWSMKLMSALNLGDYVEVQAELTALMREPFVMQKMREDPGTCPVHATLKDGTSAPIETLIALGEYILQVAKEHNEKADAYNAEHGAGD